MTAEEPPDWVLGMGRVEELQRAAEGLAVLRAAYRNGLLERLTRSRTVDELAGELQVAERRLSAVLEVLAAHGVVEEGDGSWQLARGWSPLVSGEAPFSLDQALGLVQVRQAQLEQALEAPEDYWQLDAGDRLRMALGVTFDPASQIAVEVIRRNLDALPDVVAALEGGGRTLELGCGVGARLCALLQAFPRATAVGVELAADLAEFGRRRAERLGVGERLTYVVGDALGYEPDGVFDHVGWSQFFFPRPTRAGALATARRALRPGGWLTMPVVTDGAPLQPGTSENQELAAERLALELWDVPMRSTVEMQEELAEAGFVDLRVISNGPIYLVCGRLP